MRRRAAAITLGILLAFAPGCSLLIHGQATGRPCEKGQCPTGQVCDTATDSCQPTSGCTSDADCGDPALRCDSSGACVAKCLGKVCPAGQICQRGACGVPEAQSCASAACVPGLDCVTLGSAKLCGQPCTQTTDCYNPGDVCDTDPTSPTVGYCVFNWCSPDQGGAVQKADYLAACNAAGTGDGVCVGPVAPASATTTVGFCEASGTVAPGATCTVAASFGDPGLCASGRCVPSQLGALQGTCQAWCALLDGQSCAPVNGKPQACAWSGVGLTGTCAAQQSQPIAVGSPCSPSTETLPCVADAMCLDLHDGKGMICRALCDLRTGAPCNQVCTKFKQTEPLLGVCP